MPKFLEQPSHAPQPHSGWHNAQIPQPISGPWPNGSTMAGAARALGAKASDLSRDLANDPAARAFLGRHFGPA